ncbi:MAG: DUF4442 domain-containing protein [Kofleriaceae bacterium]|nr:DUF4442 domain-containing protein [Kofleriaceae bacterium]
MKFPLLPAGNANMIRGAWDRLSGLPGGKRLFSKAVGNAAPYTGSIDARVLELGHGYAKVLMADRRKVRNLLRCVHAIALANLAEVCGNLAMAYTMPDDARFIVAGLSMSYIKKARGPITAECHCPVPESSATQEYEVLVTLRNSAGEEVSSSVLRTLIGPTPG